MKTFRQKIATYVQVLQGFVDRLWYPQLVAFLAALDNLVIIVPIDGILISSSILTPRRWLTLATNVAVGSTLGAMVLASLVEYQGLPWILNIYPSVDESLTWVWTEKFFRDYGLLLVFAVAVSPIMQQPAVILAGLANVPLLKLAAVIFAGRYIKAVVMAYVGSHTPQLLDKMWGVKGELKDAGVDLKRSA